ncbi:MAG: ABC transporter ATP-binding protein [Crocinitomicaceae bacterium]|nr:ABC transporter ATP-binding protein [Crocinitomicaceae bacterium]
MSADHPLHLNAEGLGKRHGRQWVLRGIHLEIKAGSVMAILGSNGSGKSSLLRMLCGFDAPSEGTLLWTAENLPLQRNGLPGHIAYCAPDQSLILDLTVSEHIEAHGRLRQMLDSADLSSVLELAMLSKRADARVRDLSSGMRQRLALSLAFCTDASAIFLDEPVSHLDRDGRKWYSQLLDEWRLGRTLIVASNHNAEEYPKTAERFELGS